MPRISGVLYCTSHMKHHAPFFLVLALVAFHLASLSRGSAQTYAQDDAGAYTGAAGNAAWLCSTTTNGAINGRCEWHETVLTELLGASPVVIERTDDCPACCRYMIGENASTTTPSRSRA